MSKDKYYQPLPQNVTLQKSKVHGLGVFASSYIPAGHDFGITHVEDSRFTDNYIRTPLGGFVNHSTNANVDFIQIDDYKKLVVIKDIEAGEELLAKYSLYDPSD